MKLSKVHLNIGSEDKPKGLCGRKAKYTGYAEKRVFNTLPFEDQCMFCRFKNSEVSQELQEYWDGSIVGQLKKKEIKII